MKRTQDTLFHPRYGGGFFSTSFKRLDLQGEDVESFLQSQSTFDVYSLGPRSFQLISFLDRQGRVLFYSWLVKDTHFSLLVPSKLIESAQERLQRFLISEDVEISKAVDQDAIFFWRGLDFSPENHPMFLEGVLFNQKAGLVLDKNLMNVVSDGDEIESSIVENWRLLTGWPSFDGADHSVDILNHTRLFDLSLTLQKGCYPGQETVSKIANNRGASFAPVLLEVMENHDEELSYPREIYSFHKKIGKVFGKCSWMGKSCYTAVLLRDFRVEGMEAHFSWSPEDEGKMKAQVRYYPYISGDSVAEDLYYLGTDFFRDNQIEFAEMCFRESLKMNPRLLDAYESLGVMLGREGRYSEAIELMKDLASLDENSVLAHTNLSLFYMKVGKIEEAEQHKSMATLKSFQHFGSQAQLEEELRKKKEQEIEEWNRRESMFNQVLEIDPDDTLANFGLGSIAVEKEDWEKGKHFLEKVIKVDEKYSVAYLHLGKALKNLGQRDEALEILEKGISVAASKGDFMPANQMQELLRSLKI